MSIEFVQEGDFVVKGSGSGNRGSKTYDTLLEIKKHCEDNPKDRGRLMVVGEWSNPNTASGVARSITQANTNKQKVGNQRVPSGYWVGQLSKQENEFGMWVVSAKYLGVKMTREHPEFG